MRFNLDKTTFYFLGLILLLNLTSDIFGQNKVKSKSKTKINAVQISEDERRKEVESLLLKGKYQHDGSGELMYIGSIESVSALLKVLADNPPNIYQPCPAKIEIEIPPPPLKNSSLPQISEQQEIPKKDCTPKKIYICTYAHAVSALRKITGQNFVDLDDWKNWWESYQKKNSKLD